MTCENDSWIRRKKTCDVSPGRRLAYVERESEGPLALLIHGFTDSSRSFSLIEPFLEDLGLIMPDLPGHGHSTTLNEGYDIESLAREVASLMDRLEKKPDVIVGHSLGSLIALKLASREYQGAAQLVLISGSLKPSIGENTHLCEWISAISDPIDPAAPFFDYWYESSHGVPPSHFHRLRVEAAAVRTDVWRKVFRTLETCDLTQDAKALITPALTIAGAEDKLFDHRHRTELCQALQGHEHFLMDLVGHNPHWERPKEIAKLISRFVSDGREQISGSPKV